MASPRAVATPLRGMPSMADRDLAAPVGAVLIWFFEQENRGGGMKQSGGGREGVRGEEALRFFTEPKNVGIAK